MQFIDLQRQYHLLKDNIHARMQAVLDHGQYIMGPEIEILEKRLAQYAGTKHCITVANGTDALLVALMALGIKSSDEVITSPFSFIASAEMIALAGARPVFADIDPDTYNIDPARMRAAITTKTTCLMPISLYGQCANLSAIQKIADQHRLPVIEDAAQSFGALCHGKRACSLSTIATTSFFPSKPLGCYGDGGACFTNDDTLATAMRQIRVHGQDKRYSHPRIGMNSRLDTLQAAILLAKLDTFDAEITARQQIAGRYHTLLPNTLKKTRVLPGHTSVHAQYTIEVPNRPAVQAALHEKGIPTAIHYPKPLHLQTALAQYGGKPGDFPVAEQAASRVISLPMHPWLTETEQRLIARVLVDALNTAMPCWENRQTVR